MEQNTLIVIAATGYALFFAIIVAVFEVRLAIIHRRHIEKIKPYSQRGIKRLDRRVRLYVRLSFLAMIVCSMASIYFLV